MFYLFNSDLKCIKLSATKITPANNEFIKELSNVFAIDYLYWDVVNDTFKFILPEDDPKEVATTIRNNLRSQIDMFLMPAATYKDEFVTDEEKALLKNDSLLLARWPTTTGWPNIKLPTLSSFANKVLDIPEWPR